MRWKAADQLPAEKRRAAIKLKRELCDQIAWSAETIRQIISGRHVVANALAEAGRVDPFWRKYWA